jgi:hypothetical protein
MFNLVKFVIQGTAAGRSRIWMLLYTYREPKNPKITKLNRKENRYLDLNLEAQEGGLL